MTFCQLEDAEMADCSEILLYYTINMLKIHFLNVWLSTALYIIILFFPAPFPINFPTQMQCAWILFSYYSNSAGNYKDDGQIRVELLFFKAVFYYIH